MIKIRSTDYSILDPSRLELHDYGKSQLVKNLSQTTTLLFTDSFHYFLLHLVFLAMRATPDVAENAK